jgi:hypothetical protein
MKALALVLLLSLPVHADEGRFTVGVRFGGLVHGGDGYTDHAAVFGFGRSLVGFAFGLAAGVQVTPRLRIVAAASGAIGSSQRRIEPDETLRITNGAYLLQAGYTPLRHDFDVLGAPWFVAVEVVAGGGVYTVADDLGGHSRSAVGPGGSAGARLMTGSGAWYMGAGYALHLSTASIHDRLGGELSAGGHEIGFELGFRL